jgi:hypothetical protein
MLFRDLLDFGAQNWRWLVITIPASLAFIAAFIFVSTKNSSDKKAGSQATDKQSLESKPEASHSEDKKPDDSEPNHEKLPRFVLIATMVLIISLVLYVIIVIGTFVEHFHQRGLQPDFDKWGQVGDYFGGMLNPILAFASFIALLYTIRIQSEELRLTRGEFAKSVAAQKVMASEAQKQRELTLLLEEYRYAANRLRSECLDIEALGEQDISQRLGLISDSYDIKTINRLMDRVSFEFHPAIVGRWESEDICLEKAKSFYTSLFPQNNRALDEHIQRYLKLAQNLVRTADVYSQLSKQLSLNEDAGTVQFLDNNRVAKLLASAYVLSGVTQWYTPEYFRPIDGDGLKKRFRYILSDIGIAQDS